MIYKNTLEWSNFLHKMRNSDDLFGSYLFLKFIDEESGDFLLIFNGSAEIRHWKVINKEVLVKGNCYVFKWVGLPELWAVYDVTNQKEL